MNSSQPCHTSLKDLGNKYFLSSQFERALSYYTQAIEKKPTESCYFSNRALCYIKLNEHEKALQDCRRALELNPVNLKAHFFAGEANLGLGNYDEAIPKLMHAHNLSLEQHVNFGDDITAVIRSAKRKKFEEKDQKRRQEETALQTYLINLVRADYERASKEMFVQPTHTLKTRCIVENVSLEAPYTSSSKLDTVTQNIHTSVIDAAESPSLTRKLSSEQCVELCKLSEEVFIKDQVSSNDGADEKMLTKMFDLHSEMQRKINDVNELFIKLEDQRRNREVPEHLCGRISSELMVDPVITPSGITYDRRSILAHLRQVGHFDPITREPLVADQLVSNLAMKEVVHLFLEENPWAEHY